MSTGLLSVQYTGSSVLLNLSQSIESINKKQILQTAGNSYETVYLWKLNNPSNPKHHIHTHTPHTCTFNTCIQLMAYENTADYCFKCHRTTRKCSTNISDTQNEVVDHSVTSLLHHFPTQMIPSHEGRLHKWFEGGRK